MLIALELRAAGASFQQVGNSLDPPVSRQRAFKIVRRALDELIKECQETAERVRQLELHRLDRLRFALSPRMSDPRVADTLLRISERVAKLHGLDAPQRIEQSGPGGGPIQTQEKKPDFSKLTLDELLLLEALNEKALGIEDWDKTINERAWFDKRCYPGRPETLLMAVSKSVHGGPSSDCGSGLGGDLCGPRQVSGKKS
jgi:hypothetical protein